MGEPRPKYPLGFKRQAVAEVRLGRTQEQVAKDLGISERNLRRWIREAEAEEASPPVDVSLLQRRIADLERENEALREANRFFAQRRRKQQQTTS
jgi:transposase-like protein